MNSSLVILVLTICSVALEFILWLISTKLTTLPVLLGVLTGLRFLLDIVWLVGSIWIIIKIRQYRILGIILLLLFAIWFIIGFVAGFQSTYQPPSFYGQSPTKETEFVSADAILQSLQENFGDISACEERDYKDYECIKKVAILTDNYELCEKIPVSEVFTKILRERNDCYQTIAIHTNNIALCDKIEGSDPIYFDINYCKAIAAKDISYCEKVLTPEDASLRGLKVRCKEDLRMDFAAKTNNPPICKEFVEFIEIKFDCYSKVALYSQDTEICDSIPRYDTKEIKFSWYHIPCKAMANKDPSICDTLEDVVPVDNCYHQVAVVKQDVSICDKIVRSWIKRDCVEDIFFSNPFYIGDFRIENYRPQ